MLRGLMLSSLILVSTRLSSPTRFGRLLCSRKELLFLCPKPTTSARCNAVSRQQTSPLVISHFLTIAHFALSSRSCFVKLWVFILVIAVIPDPKYPLCGQTIPLSITLHRLIACGIPTYVNLILIKSIACKPCWTTFFLPTPVLF